MSKIGRKPIDFSDLDVTIDGKEISIKGKQATDLHVLPDELRAEITEDKKHIKILCDDISLENKMSWGLHRALLSNKIKGVKSGFEKDLIINGLGFKGALSGDKIIFSLGYSHKIEFPLPQGIKVEIDKTGQNIKVKGLSKELVGTVCSEIRSLRSPEPYKGTGIKLASETIIRKAGKTKSA